MCPWIQTFELDSANTRVTSHLISSFAVIFSYIGSFQIIINHTSMEKKKKKEKKERIPVLEWYTRYTKERW